MYDIDFQSPDRFITPQSNLQDVSILSEVPISARNILTVKESQEKFRQGIFHRFHTGDSTARSGQMSAVWSDLF